MLFACCSSFIIAIARIKQSPHTDCFFFTPRLLFITKFVCLFEYPSVELPFRARAMFRRNLFLKSKGNSLKKEVSAGFSAA